MAPAGGRQSEPVYLDDHDESEEDDTAEALNRANKLMANVSDLDLKTVFAKAEFTDISRRPKNAKKPNARPYMMSTSNAPKILEAR